ncbi:MAG: hypothetical protein ABIQ65_12265 [Thermoanaerobaculia bacterium]
MAKSGKTTGGAEARVTRHSRDLALELKKAQAALTKAQAIATKLAKLLSASAKPFVTRPSRDL